MFMGDQYAYLYGVTLVHIQYIIPLDCQTFFYTTLTNLLDVCHNFACHS